MKKAFVINGVVVVVLVAGLFTAFTYGAEVPNTVKGWLLLGAFGAGLVLLEALGEGLLALWRKHVVFVTIVIAGVVVTAILVAYASGARM